MTFEDLERALENGEAERHHRSDRGASRERL
jgi:hypothetical protein